MQILAIEALNGAISSAHAIVSNNPSWWPIIDSDLFYCYWAVAAGIMVIYDWVLTIGQEIELIWICYTGIPYSVVSLLAFMPLVSLTDAAISFMLGAIMIARLYAMYQGSRMMLIFLVVVFLAVNIACGVIVAIGFKDIVAEELILSGMYMCSYAAEGDAELLNSMIWVLNAIWEVLALCLSVWIAVKHFYDL
ncbi:uncharacterized protein F5147DRAFT_773227 [Suillus discolor]|uniref:DUF6533 domain-containing protein n=1 Tax=Suillus discolor TaxID=1912936 RepID=A0A9P7F6M4_9AGAM|nr:uncharacterized protein F5147DRAFT_773227 [Suillus discolor]KAG2108893.1 hypothetical protein F5147DRAFT_773227 [Suillus discolor]